MFLFMLNGMTQSANSEWRWVLWIKSINCTLLNSTNLLHFFYTLYTHITSHFKILGRESNRNSLRMNTRDLKILWRITKVPHCFRLLQVLRFIVIKAFVGYTQNKKQLKIIEFIILKNYNVLLILSSGRYANCSDSCSSAITSNYCYSRHSRS